MAVGTSLVGRAASAANISVPPAPFALVLAFSPEDAGPQVRRGRTRAPEMTPAGARQHSSSLKRSAGGERGPTRRARAATEYWRLTPRGHERFPDRHSDLTLDYCQSMRDVFGDDGRERVIEHRERRDHRNYRKFVGAPGFASSEADALARIRSREGYMASRGKDTRDSFLLIENHCPIWRPATACQGLCRSELAVFAPVWGPT